jgi:hypothetical protein
VAPRWTLVLDYLSDQGLLQQLFFRPMYAVAPETMLVE